MAVSTQDFIHRYLPPSNDQRTTLLLLHGTGGNEQSLLSLGAEIAPGVALLSPRGKVMEGNYPRFFRRKAEGVFDIEDLIARTHELADWIEAASSEYHISNDSLVAVGYSNGANMAASILLLRPGVLKHAILFRAMQPLQPEQVPDLVGTQVLMLSGKVDPIIPLSLSENLARLLKACGAQVTFELQPTDHSLTDADIKVASEWISKVGLRPR